MSALPPTAAAPLTGGFNPDTPLIVQIDEIPPPEVDNPRQATVTTAENGDVQIYVPHGCQITFKPRDPRAMHTPTSSAPTTPTSSRFESALTPAASTSTLSPLSTLSVSTPQEYTSGVKPPYSSAHSEAVGDIPSEPGSPVAHSPMSPVVVTAAPPQTTEDHYEESTARPRQRRLGFIDREASAERDEFVHVERDLQTHSCPNSGKRQSFSPTMGDQSSRRGQKDPRRPMSSVLPTQATSRENAYASTGSLAPHSYSPGYKSPPSSAGKRNAPYPRPASLASSRPVSADPVGMRSTPYHNTYTVTSPRSSQISVASRTPERILFYHKHDPHYGFTNFSDHPVEYRAKMYPTSEHLFQASKFIDHRPLLAEHIRKVSRRPAVAFSEARRFQPEVRPDWLKVNIEMMDNALRLKFTQHLDLREELLQTGTAELVEDSDKDAFWGVGHDGRGRNELGKALMRLREALRKEDAEARRRSIPRI
ncbi:hypothetical protein BD626DRAFT_491843 [Schizophyllum amplum]|uniref:NADAR domain-containing protein n=1 Tax=Schizophyllum amplum TaxID=97359 RepID=A0A550CI26_9AGAR|nr:hypothetical protein BD626DRAFT_491843 [Auriculariopsis ampla]